MASCPRCGRGAPLVGDTGMRRCDRHGNVTTLAPRPRTFDSAAHFEEWERQMLAGTPQAA